MNETKIGVLHLVDSLASGGAEHVAVMLANNLPQERYRASLCASREAGPLQSEIQPHVTVYDLRRKYRFDISALKRLVAITRRENIDLIHAHSSSLFMGVVVAFLNPKLKVIWHDHTGVYGMKSRSVFLYRFFVRRTQAVFSVTRNLADWSVRLLGVHRESVHYLPNFVESRVPANTFLELSGRPGKRIVCVANVRAQKDHHTLLRAMAQVIKTEPRAHLILVGAESDSHLVEQARLESKRLGLESSLTWLGSREDVPLILANCDIGILSSVSEGFPVVLLEYGRAGLAVVATQVGECTEILEEGEAGLLVPPSNPDSLAAALLRLLKSPALRTQLGERLNQRVKQTYNAETIVNQVCEVYEQLL